MGWLGTEPGAAVWLTEDGTPTRVVAEARVLDSVQDAERWATELTAARHLGLHWMPAPEREDDLGDLQMRTRRPWRSRIASGPPADW